MPLEIMEEPGRLVQPDLMVELAPLANKELKAELVLQGRSVHSELTAGLGSLNSPSLWILLKVNYFKT